MKKINFELNVCSYLYFFGAILLGIFAFLLPASYCEGAGKIILFGNCYYLEVTIVCFMFAIFLVMGAIAVSIEEIE